MLYFHGGAYVAGMAPQQWALVSRIVDAGIRVDVADYGLAPKYTHRDAYPFITEAYRALVGEVGADAITLIGGSAGAGLALGLTQTLAIETLPLPAHLLLISPWLDVTLTNPEIPAIQHRDPWVSPLNGPLDALRPTHVYIGTRDILYPDAIEFRDRATAAGSLVTLEACSGAVHVYPLVPAPEGRSATRDIVRRLVG